MLTLSVLHSFCVKNPGKRVRGVQQNDDDFLRRMLTKSVFTDKCFNFQNPISKKKSTCNCNVCSARFSPLPHFHTSGNMWVADCFYVWKLIDPLLLQSKTEDAVNIVIYIID